MKYINGMVDCLRLQVRSACLRRDKGLAADPMLGVQC